MTKKQVWKQVFKYIGIGAGICAGIIGLVAGFIGITGGFKPKHVAIKSCSFNIETDKFQGLSNNIPVFVINEDSTFVVDPNPEDCTELDGKLQIKSGDTLVKDVMVEAEEQPKEVEEPVYVSAEKVGNKYLITLGKPFKIVLGDNQTESLEPRTIELYVECESEYCEAKVFVDSKLESFDLKYEKISDIQSDKLFEGDYVYAYLDIDSILAKSSLCMSDLVELTKDFKKYEFSIDNETVASIEEVGINTSASTPILNYKKGFPYAKIKILTSGKFNVSLSVCDLYSNEEKILTNEEYINLPDDEVRELYDEWIKDVLIENSLNFQVSDVEIGSISANKTELNLELYKSQRYSATNLGLKVNPTDIPGSPFTSDNLSNYIQHIEIVGGVFVLENEDYDIEIGEGESKQFIKFSDKFVQTRKEQGINEPSWVVSVLETTSSKTCLVAYLTVGEDTWYDFIPVNIEPIQTIDLTVKKDNALFDLIELEYDKAIENQKTYTELSNAWVFDTESNQTLQSLIQSGKYPYKSFVFVVEDSEGNYKLADDIISLEITQNGYVLTPISRGNSKICAVILKTDINGNLLDKENNAIVNQDGTTVIIDEDVLARCQIVAKSDYIDVQVRQVLKILPESTLTLYKENAGSYEEIAEDDEMFIIKKDNLNSVYEATIYNGQKVYLKLNVNDEEALYEAFNDTLVFRLGTEIVQADKFVKLGTSLIEATIDGETVYLLSIEIFNVTDESLVESLIVDFNGKRQCNLSLKAKKFVLENLTLLSNTGNEESNSADVYLVLNSQNDNMYWTVDSGKQEKELEVSLKKSPSQAEGHDEIVYKIYSLKDESVDISTLNNLTDDIIKQYFVEDTSVLEIKSGYPIYNEDDVPVLQFDVKKQGRAILIAYCTRYDDNVKVFSNPFVINTKYPFLKEQEFNYGTNYEVVDTDYTFVKTQDTQIDANKTYYTLNDLEQYVKVDSPVESELNSYYEQQFAKYRQIVASYDGQLTNLIDFIGYEKKKITENGEGVEGQKIGLQWKLTESEEVNYSILRPSLYNFEIISNMKYDFITDNQDGNILNYLKTNRVTEKVYIKIKISTKFGYELSQTYNYVLIPDYYIENGENTTQNINAGDSVTLFDLKIDENNLIVNDGGLYYITNSSYSNYRVGNDSKITGFDGDLITVIYMPLDMRNVIINKLKDNYGFTENESADSTEKNITTNSTNDSIIYFVLDGKQYEIRFVLRFNYTDPNGDVKIKEGKIKSSAVLQGIAPTITINGYYCFTDGENLSEYMESGIFKFKLNVEPISQIKLNENAENNVTLSSMGTSLETVFASGKQISLNDIVSLQIKSGMESLITSQTEPTCSLVGDYGELFKIENGNLVMTGSIVENYKLKIDYSYTVTLENGLTKTVDYTLNLLVKTK